MKPRFKIPTGFHRRTQAGLLLALGSFLFAFLTYRLGTLPNGVFCDEAQIGVSAWELWKGDFTNIVNPFFYRNFEYYLGNWSVYATLPWVVIFGLSEFSLRFTGVFWALISAFFLFRSFKLLKLHYGAWAIALTFCSGLFLHLARINIGHFSSFAALSAGWFFFVRFFSSQDPRPKHLILGTALVTLSGYAQMAFIVYAPFFLGIMTVFMGFQETTRKRYKLWVLTLGLTYFLCEAPFLWGAIEYPPVSQRIFDKNAGGASFFSLEKLRLILSNYTKYWNPQFLLLNGDQGLPGAHVSRLTVPGMGVLSKLCLLILSFSLLPGRWETRSRFKLRLLAILGVLLFPTMDLLTTKDGHAPYAFSLLCGLFWVPLATALGLETIFSWIRRLKLRTLGLGLIFLLASTELSQSWKKYFVEYPLVSSDFWGWQYGPKEILAYFKAHQDEYDELWMSGAFNGPRPFLTLYDPDRECRKCELGGIRERFNPTKRQLFAPRLEEWVRLDAPLRELFEIIGEVKLPDGRVEFVYVRAKTTPQS